ncbi:hypothetical protein BKA69DRAFT_1123671 [Paraphysoderma sedebokerense]|nr:hypothetical protein BKA69DRAFT_1123653 [Paraphysoderma sedebokerense]KAI9142899.1 hypothetical protein BKA69DRAFT_1123671 [Paraphysoderma sedebokerense]
MDNKTSKPPHAFPSVYRPAPANYAYPADFTNASPYPLQNLPSYQQANFAVPVQPRLQTESFPIIYFAGWRPDLKIAEMEKADLLPQNFVPTVKARFDSIMDSPLARATQSVKLVIIIAAIAFFLSIIMTFFQSKLFAIPLPLPLFIFPVIFLSIILLFILHYKLHRRFESCCESITKQSTEIYGQKIQVELRQGKTWTSGRTRYHEVFEFYDKNGQRITSSLFVRVTFQIQIMVPVLQSPFVTA